MSTTTTNPRTTADKPASASAAVQVQPYLFFNGRAEEALEFYRRAADGEITSLMRFKDSPPAGDGSGGGCAPQPGTENKVMHATIRIGATEVMVSDGQCDGTPNFQGFSLSLTVRTEADAARFFKALSEGGTVQVPLGPTFFSPAFGMLADRFGVGWIVYMFKS
jgi:PhnB protein